METKGDSLGNGYMSLDAGNSNETVVVIKGQYSIRLIPWLYGVDRKGTGKSGSKVGLIVSQ